MSMTEPNPRILSIASRALGHLEVVFLVVIALATLIASGQEILAMVGRGHVALADLLLVDGNPVENIKLLENPEKNLLVIMKDGKVYKNLVGQPAR